MDFPNEQDMQIEDEFRKSAEQVKAEHVDDHFVEIFLTFVQLLHLFLTTAVRVEGKVFFASNVLSYDAN